MRITISVYNISIKCRPTNGPTQFYFSRVETLPIIDCCHAKRALKGFSLIMSFCKLERHKFDASIVCSEYKVFDRIQ